MALTVVLVLAAPAFGRGDKVIPQVADGPGIVTKFDLINVSDGQPIQKFKLRFYHQDGTPWSIRTTLGTGSEFLINMNPRQRLHVETLGQTSPQTAGYAIVRDDETANSTYSVDYVLGITAYYATSSGGAVTGVVSVPPSDPTMAFSLPVEMNVSGNLLTGLAIVNLSNAANQIALRLFAATDPPTGPVGSPSTTTMTLQPGQQRAEFIQQVLFPNASTFKGVLEGTASGPVSLLGLVQISTPTGVQYATITPTLRDHLRANSNMLIIQPWVTDSINFYPFDIDDVRVDYLQNTVGDEAVPWDVKYVTVSRSARQLLPVNGAGLVSLGNMSDNTAFDNLTLVDLRAKNYSTTTPVDMSAVAMFDAFAVHTSLGNYAKMRVVRVIETVDNSTGDKYLDLGLEVYVYK